MSVLGFVADPFEGWSDPYASEDLGQFKSLERGALHRGASQQISNAEKRKPLRSYKDETHANRWYSGPTNNIGAYYRLAYWYAVASRIANTQGNAQLSSVLLSDAKLNLSKASKAANTGVDAKGNETQILQSGAKNLRGAGFTGISALVGQQSTRVDFAQELRKATGAELAIPDFVSKTAQLKTLAGTRPWWFWPLIGGAGIVALAIIFRPVAVLASTKGK